jgi:hypothetical protein
MFNIVKNVTEMKCFATLFIQLAKEDKQGRAAFNERNPH